MTFCVCVAYIYIYIVVHFSFMNYLKMIFHNMLGIKKI